MISSPYVPRRLHLSFLVHHQGLHAAVEVNGTEATAPGEDFFHFMLSGCFRSNEVKAQIRWFLAAERTPQSTIYS